jgi:hypothetical protein
MSFAIRPPSFPTTAFPEAFPRGPPHGPTPILRSLSKLPRTQTQPTGGVSAGGRRCGAPEGALLAGCLLKFLSALLDALV